MLKDNTIGKVDIHCPRGCLLPGFQVSRVLFDKLVPKASEESEVCNPNGNKSESHLVYQVQREVLLRRRLLFLHRVEV